MLATNSIRLNFPEQGSIDVVHQALVYLEDKTYSLHVRVGKMTFKRSQELLVVPSLYQECVNTISVAAGQSSK